MTVERTRSEIRRGHMQKALRAGIRLKHSLLADEELNTVLPAAERAFDAALQQGQLPDAVDVDEIVREVLKDA